MRRHERDWRDEPRAVSRAWNVASWVAIIGMILCALYGVDQWRVEAERVSSSPVELEARP